MPNIISYIAVGLGFVLLFFLVRDILHTNRHIADLRTEVDKLKGSPSVVVNVGEKEPGSTPPDPDKARVLNMMNGLYEYTKRQGELDVQTLSAREQSEFGIQSVRAGLYQRDLTAMGLNPEKSDDRFEWQIYLEWMIPLVEQKGVEVALAETRHVREIDKRGDPPE